MVEKTPILLLEKKATLLLSSKYPCTYSPLPPGLVTQSLNQTSKAIPLKCPVQFVVRGQQWAERRQEMFIVGLDNDFCFSRGCNETVRLFRKGSRVEVVQELLSQYLSGRFLCKMSLQKHVSTLEMNVLSHEQKNIFLRFVTKLFSSICISSSLQHDMSSHGNQIGVGQGMGDEFQVMCLS